MQGCNLLSVNKQPGVSTIVAQGRDRKADMGGFSFVNCKVTGQGKQNMNRAWRKFSRVVFCNCYLDAVVTPGGWDDHGISDHSYFSLSLTLAFSYNLCLNEIVAVILMLKISEIH